MRLPKFLQILRRDSGKEYYQIYPPEDKEKTDFLHLFSLDRAKKRVREVYETDPNKLDPKEIAEIFSEILRGLEALKQVKPTG